MITNKETTIKKIIQETHDTKTFIIDSTGIPHDFLPGQFYMLQADINGTNVRRAYSIATSPTEQEIGFTIKLTPNGNFSTHSFYNFKEQDKLLISGPYGKFLYQEEQTPIVLIGAGSGIAPLRSIAKYIIDKQYTIPVMLFFSNKTERDIIYEKEFLTWQQQHNNFTTYFTITTTPTPLWKGPTGRITKETLTTSINPQAHYYICGPPEFVRTIESILKEFDIKEEHIKTEKYH